MLALAPSADVVVMAAAVADFRPKAVAAEKLKKADGVPEIVLEPTADILAELGARKRAGQVVVGFAAETDDVSRERGGQARGQARRPHGRQRRQRRRRRLRGRHEPASCCSTAAGRVDELPLLTKDALADWLSSASRTLGPIGGPSA